MKLGLRSFLAQEGPAMDEANKTLSRRQAVGMASMGVATAAAGSAKAQRPNDSSSSSSARPTKDDPRAKYPKPPFQEQTQPWPGLASKMNPKPDHGETSYRGKQLVAEAVQKLGGLDVVVCNAGRQQSKASILDVSDEDFDATMKTNIYAPFYIIKAALPHLSEGSCIIGTTSEQAYDPAPDLYDYAQTKAATMNYVKSLAKQLGPKGIRVNGVAPGPIWTPLQISGGASVLKYTHFGNTSALARPGQPAELASIYVQLAASDASFTTGNIYGAGGGQG
jgi:NADP-dependent 3-hydroxy acid dehydrogenase YdfG